MQKELTFSSSGEAPKFSLWVRSVPILVARFRRVRSREIQFNVPGTLPDSALLMGRLSTGPLLIHSPRSTY